ncbi:rod shape-determining protein RodA [Sansalvadorimonas sp. 2012CJ34-2]|uniref:Peptidoglycan glycosyltransferase MrdB n=1 Tax=Parendozoicomonas callyspongiae TaxID=2942213 RepID=A0ABT0PCM1_9GAMM|nr:rod shape-determining protein RodA [Sansalvadorimonas sp. 2012CJ34-2]MCL6269124.1 rod shape-determining protein RodA [Sansalvadorimonas sp. 2012CJ34-2]
MSQDFIRQLDPKHDLRAAPALSTRLHLDPVLLLMLLGICSVGLFILYSASGQNLDMVMRQAIYMVVGFVTLFIVAQIPPRFLQRLAPIAYVGGVVLLVGVLVMGEGAKGAQRWIQLPGFRFQPSEIIKLVMPLTVAAWLTRKPLPPSLADTFISLALIGVPVVLIAKQPDLGTSLLIAASGMFVMLLAGLRWRVIGSAVLLALPAVWVMWHYVMREYQKQRVLTFLNPESDPWGSGWNIIQSKISIGSGGLYGKGWLLGTQSHLEFLPESHTDFIFAVLSEEFGLIGVLVLLAVYALIIGRGIFITMHAQNMFARLVAGSVTLTFFVYIFVNIGMVSGLLPVVGVPLPLVSRGGTSLVTLMAGFGLLMSAHTHRNFLGR